MKSVAIIMVLLPFAASAATITVNSTADNITAGNGQCTLRKAIANVNAAADTTGGDCVAGTGAGDTIKFTFGMPAKIRLKLGELLIQRDVSIENPAPGSLRIDGGGSTRVLEIATGTAAISGVTIEHGNAASGGGIMVGDGASLSLTNCTLAANTANDLGQDFDEDVDAIRGGAIYSAGRLALTDCRLFANRATVTRDGAIGELDGGAIYNAAGNVFLTNCVVARNAASPEAGGFANDVYGGGIYNAGGNVTLARCLLARNSVNPGPDGDTGSGGGISNVEGSLTLSACRLIGNRAVSPVKQNSTSIMVGGGIFNSDGTVDVTDTTIARNRVTSRIDTQSLGGGIFNEGGSMRLNGCTVDRNVAIQSYLGEALGGGIYNEADATMTVHASTFTSNVALSSQDGASTGGGIDNQGTMTLTDCTLVRNQARGCTVPDSCAAFGGGIYSEGALTVANCTLDGNTARAAPSEFDYRRGSGLAAGDNASLTNTIIAGSGKLGNCGAPVSSGGHNLSSDDTCFAAGGSDLLSTRPQLAALGDYGGPTRTMPLCLAAGIPDTSCRAGSPAIDAGDDSVTGPPDNLNTDQRGLPRLSGAHIDIGAYEVQ